MSDQDQSKQQKTWGDRGTWDEPGTWGGEGEVWEVGDGARVGDGSVIGGPRKSDTQQPDINANKDKE